MLHLKKKKLLRLFAHPVACYCVLLGVVALSLKPVNNVGSCCVRLNVALGGRYAHFTPIPPPGRAGEFGVPYNQ